MLRCSPNVIKFWNVMFAYYEPIVNCSSILSYLNLGCGCWLGLRHWTPKSRVKVVRGTSIHSSPTASRAVCLNVWLQGLPWWWSGWESTCSCRAHRFESHLGGSRTLWSSPARVQPLLSPCVATAGARAPQRGEPPQREDRAPQPRVAPSCCS